MSQILSSTGSGAPPADTAATTIADTSYRTYTGPLLPCAAGISRWGTIARATVRQNVNRRKFGFWIPATFIAILYLVFSVIFYIQHGFQRNMGGTLGLEAPTNEFARALYNAQTPLFHVLLFATAVIVGSASIAADNRANALLVYLSKPLMRPDYLLGKWLGIFFLLATLNLIPALLMYLFFVASYYDEGILSQNPTLALKIIAASLVPAAIHTSLMIGISAWSKTPRLAGAVYAGVFFLFWTITGTLSMTVLQQKTARPEIAALINNFSVIGASDAIAQHLYQTTSQPFYVQFAQMESDGQRRREKRRKERWERAVRDAKAKGLKPPPPPKPLPPPPAPEESLVEFERPPLLPSLLIAGAFIVLPVLAASARIKAVEVVRG